VRDQRVRETRIHNDIFLFPYHVQFYFAYTHATLTKGALYSIVGVHINTYYNKYTILSSISNARSAGKERKKRALANERHAMTKSNK